MAHSASAPLRFGRLIWLHSHPSKAIIRNVGPLAQLAEQLTFNQLVVAKLKEIYLTIDSIFLCVILVAELGKAHEENPQ